MRRHPIHLIRALILGLLSGAAANSQGVYWESTTTGAMLNGQSAVSQSSYMPGMLRATTGQGSEYVIMRLDRQVMYTVNPDDRSYSALTFRELEELMKKASSQLDAKMAEMKEQLKSMPEDQRAMMEKMLAGRMPGGKAKEKVEVVNTGEHRAIAGLPCTRFLIRRGKDTLATVWTTKAVKEYASMRKDMQEVMRRLMSMNPLVGKGFVDGYLKVEGFPVETEMGGAMGIRTVVTKIEPRNTPETEFDVPAGFTKVASPLLQQEGKAE